MEPNASPTAAPATTASAAAAPATTAPANAPTGGPAFVLTATNESTVPGPQYFSVFPPPLTVTPQQPQTPLPLVSSPTEIDSQPTTTMQWPSLDKLDLIVLNDTESVEGAARTPVVPGDTAAITWKDNDFAVTVTHGTGNDIKLTFGPNMPSPSNVGLIVGPGPILVPVVGDSMTLTPSLTPTFTVLFGTAWRNGAEFSDYNPPAKITFKGTTAAIVVGFDNLITQKG